MNALDTPSTIHLSDYVPPHYGIERTDLVFEIRAGETRVENTMVLNRQGAAAPLTLHGEDLALDEVAVDGRVLSSNEYSVDDKGLTIYELPERAVLRVVTRIVPEENTALEGLYKSSGMYCTQCEAEGFRKITYYQDRPDVLSIFTTTIIADAAYPTLLANGNKIADEMLDDGRRRVVWEDPFPKPSYLFALVAGDLAMKEDAFRTASGRDVVLRIYSEPHNIEQTDYAMDALKRAMRWDEAVYGREYDLDIYMIVAVDDFNMGAMENKGLNIFNTSCVLATKDTATDQAYQRVEAVVAHEYFHNWSGNRVTCRDWFQLSLKEGFTVFRDAQFSGDMNSETVKRIEDVNLLRAVQFAEDAGPLAHPIRPASYIEISNFYTPTVYEKGAEVVGMVRTLVGPENFRQGSDLYFERHDGQAVTTEDFLDAMQTASGIDLGQFQRWYDQAGTPELALSGALDGDRYVLTLKQSCPATPGQPEKAPFHLPIALGLLDGEGGNLLTDDLEITGDSEVERRGETLLVHLKTEESQLTFRPVVAAPEVSLLRGFSAPVKAHMARSDESLALLAKRDPDGFASWDALQTLLVTEIGRLQGGAAVSATVLEVFEALLETRPTASGDAQAEANFLLATKLTVPSESYLFEQVAEIDVDGLCAARDLLLDHLARELVGQWQALLQAMDDHGPYEPDALSMSRRALKNLALAYLARTLPADELGAMLEERYARADNLTDRRAVLAAAVNALPGEAVTERLLAGFYDRWQGEALVVNQWLLVQATGVATDVAALEALAAHPAFEITNPNKVRSVLTAFAGANQRNFHTADGSGYRYIGERIVELNAINPQMAAALTKPLARFRRYSGERRHLMQQTLKAIAAADGLSTDVYEIVSKSLD